jgi:iron(II)-dependent oxidoreductase
MLLSFLDDLMKSRLLQGDMSEYNIYNALVDYWLLRDESKTKVPQKELLRACEILAVELQKNGTRSLPEKDLDFRIADMSDLGMVKSIDIKGRSLLNKNSEGDYRFAHYSIQEFLAVKRFIDYPGLRVDSKIHATDFMLQLLLYQCEENPDYLPVFSRFVFPGADDLAIVFQGAKKVYKNKEGFFEAEFGDGIVMIYIPAGEFTMGSDQGNDNERPEHRVYLDGYWIGKYQVTFEQYDKYCEDTGKDRPKDKGWGRGDLPVIYVSWQNVTAYCEWLNKETGLNFNLPTEAQWEKAARGTDSRTYPWGNTFAKNKCNSEESGLEQTSPVGKFPAGAGPYGCHDMAGNVWEWCSDWYDGKYYEKSHGKNPTGPDSGEARVLRGGDWFLDAGRVRAAYRDRGVPSYRWSIIGFRLSRGQKSPSGR